MPASNPPMESRSSEDRRLRSIRPHLERRARVFRAVRDFFQADGYLEVETPCRVPALAPEAHIEAVSTEGWYLQTSPELCMKRLMAAGYERIFQVCRCFRKGERGDRHLPELTLLEWYTAGVDYGWMMTQCEALIRFTARRTGAGSTLSYQGRTIPLAKPWTRMPVAEAFDRYGTATMETALETGCFDEQMGLSIEPHLGWDRPVFLYDYPAEMGALAKLKPAQPRLAERFELYIGGVELCNGFSELTDPLEQRQRFEREIAYRHAAGKAVTPMPERFLRSLSRMPAAAGNALGMDRLVMLMCNTRHIGDVVAFAPETL